MMTEKRFMIDNESDIIEFNYNTNEYIQDFMWADGKSWDRICNRLNELFDENEQLKKRNENQYQQLNKLWKLIEKRDWETLTAMDKKMKEDEERLRNEWKCYE